MNPFNQIKGLIAPFVLFSFVGNAAILVSPIFMMQVLDRVVPSGNLSTLLLLLLVCVGFLVFNAFVEVQKNICQKRTAHWVEKTGTEIAMQKHGEESQTIINNVVTLRNFMKSSQVSMAINIPWIPLFLLALFLIHPYFCLLVIAIVSTVLALKYIFGLVSNDPKAAANRLSGHETRMLQDALNPKIILGSNAISRNLIERHFDFQKRRQSEETIIEASSASYDAGLGFIRTAAQLLALSVGALLVVNGELTSGGMIGASIIAAKSIQTIEGAINVLPSLRETKHAFASLSALNVGETLVATEVTSLSGSVTCKDLIFPRGNGAPPRLDRVSLELEPGECLAIIGESGSGKTTLLNAMCGVHPCPIGSVFLDETEVRTIGLATATHSIGYLPQQAQLVRGTVAENISCFEMDPDDDKIIEAAKTAGVHGLISALPNAYQTDLSTDPHLLSAGQKQRVALARAIFQKPKYLFLDEPNALLDASGERQLCDTLAMLKKMGTTLIMVLHRSGIMGLADKVLVLDNGRVADFGARAEVLGRMNDGKQRLTLPMNEHSLQDLSDWLNTLFLRHTDSEFCSKAQLVATEMFNTARQNGPKDSKREGTMVFRFIDQDHCELILKEDRPTSAVDKMGKVRSLIKHPEVNMLDIPSDEIGLAVLCQLTDKLNVENVDNASLFTSYITSDKFRKQQAAIH